MNVNAASEICRLGGSFRIRAKRFTQFLHISFFLAFSSCITSCRNVPPLSISFSQSSQSIAVYDFVEIAANVAVLHAQNPFSDVTFHGWFASAGGTKRWNVEGFCDSTNGSVFRIRFMPPASGEYKYSVE